jgi:PPM family protein phosphatase
VNKFFRNLFGKHKPRKDNVTTAPLSEAQITSIIQNQSPRYEPQQFVVGCGQSVGKQRDLNEDSLLAFTGTLAGNASGPLFGLFIVADGMGGHQYGEVASNAAARTMAGYILRRFHPSLFSLPAEPVDESLQEIMQSAVNEAQRVVLREAPGSGTTLTAALILGQQMTIAHVGDSRASLIYPDGRIEVVTRDHSLVKRLEELGQLTSDEASTHPQRNVLYRALGQGDVLEADIMTLPFPQGSTLMLSSDGLWGVVSEENILRTVLESPSLPLACQNLVEAANLAGGPDNITAILVQMLT